jgi:hypothetical protein
MDRQDEEVRYILEADILVLLAKYSSQPKADRVGNKKLPQKAVCKHIVLEVGLW